MDTEKIIDTAKELVADNKGIIAMDEGIENCNKRFATVNIPQTIEYRRDYRDLIITTPNLSDYISGLILCDETIRQFREDRTPFISFIIESGIIPGIKVDKGEKKMAGHYGEMITEGIDGLEERLTEYALLGARFAKWRVEIIIDNYIPSRGGIDANAHTIARFAAICQEVGLVPIIEPEVMMTGEHTISRCYDVTKDVLHSVFNQLYKQGVLLEGIILKPNMVISGMQCPSQATVIEVAEATINCMLQTVPAAVQGIAFLSGGQSCKLASEHLNEINKTMTHKVPWALTFSYSRAIQLPVLEIWKGKHDNIEIAQCELLHRVICNYAARRGDYSTTLERA